MNNIHLSRWKDAADAAKTVVDLPQKEYALYTHCSTLLRAFDNAKIIFTGGGAASNPSEVANYPIGFNKGQIGITSYRDMSDAYEVLSTGKLITAPTSDGNPENPCPGRTSRLALNIVTNMGRLSTLSAVTKPVQVYFGSKDGGSVNSTPKPGLV
ncbi:MAG: hypothetical protein H7Z13_11270 [Ferruginibacter sp.]|nr:hypothetical protein [Ferruginibacter sp.]